MMSSRVTGAALISGFVLGLVTAKTAMPAKSFVLDKTINVIPLAALVLSVFVSVAFFRRFEKQKYSDKLKKDALLTRLRKPLDRLCDLEAHCDPGPAKYLDVVSDLKKLRRDFVAYAHFATAVDQPVAKSQSKHVFDGVRSLNMLLTNTPRDNVVPRGAPLQVIEGHLLISPDRAVEVQRGIESVERALGVIETSVIVTV